MITEQHELLYATFSNTAKSVVSVLWVDSETKEISEEVIEVKKDDISWNHLLKYITIEEINENTVKKNNEERDQFINMVKEIGKKEGLIFKKKSSDEVVSMPIKDILSTTVAETKEDKENLFNIKLKIFEHPAVKDCNDRSLKSKIRKAQSPIEALALASGLILNTESESSGQSSE